jgi:hypothetical protein
MPMQKRDFLSQSTAEAFELASDCLLDETLESMGALQQTASFVHTLVSIGMMMSFVLHQA